MKKRLLSLALAFMLCLGLVIPVLAAEQPPEISITWLPESSAEPVAYNHNLNWISVRKTISQSYSQPVTYDDYVVDMKTGEKVSGYECVYAFSEGLAKVRKDGKWGYMDGTGAMVVPTEYDDAGDFSEGLAKVQKNGKWGYINKTGAVVVPLGYDEANDFHDGMAVVRIGDGNSYATKYGYVGKTGALIVPLKYDEANDFSEGMAVVGIRNTDYAWPHMEHGYIDTTGAEVVPVGTYYRARSFSEGLAMVTITLNAPDDRSPIIYQYERCGYIDKTGKEVIPLQYDMAGTFSEGLAMIGDVSGEGPDVTYLTDKFGFIDKTGTVVVPVEYDYVDTFSEGLVLVGKNNPDPYWKYKYDFIDQTGTVVVPLGKYDAVQRFSEGLTEVYKSGSGIGFIDKTGAEVVPLKYDEVGTLTTGDTIFWVGKAGETGEMNYGVFVSPYSDSSSAEPSTPTTPTTPSTPAVKAVLSPQKLTVDGKDIECEKYNIDGSNYFKLRDLAQLLNGTESQFAVGYDEATSTVTITTGKAYVSTGTELVTGVDNSATAQPSNQTILINGVAHGDLTVYNIGGSNFFQLRELGNILGFEVDYDVTTDTAIVNSVQK